MKRFPPRPPDVPEKDLHYYGDGKLFFSAMTILACADCGERIYVEAHHIGGKPRYAKTKQGKPYKSRRTAWLRRCNFCKSERGYRYVRCEVAVSSAVHGYMSRARLRAVRRRIDEDLGAHWIKKDNGRWQKGAAARGVAVTAHELLSMRLGECCAGLLCAGGRHGCICATWSWRRRRRWVSRVLHIHNHTQSPAEGDCC